MDALLTVIETAAVLRVDKQTVYRLIWSDQLPWVDISTGGKNRRIRIRQSAIETWMAAREKGTQAA